MDSDERNFTWQLPCITRGADKSLALERKQQATGLKKCIYSTYSPLSSTHVWLRCSNFFNPSKKNYFGCAANKKRWNRKRQSFIRTPTYIGKVQNLNFVKICQRVKNRYSLFSRVQAGSGTHPASYPMSTGGKAAGTWCWPLSST
jgi:hypothetical protein